MMKIMAGLYDLNRGAMQRNDYEAAMVFTTAEDLADGMLKGSGLTHVNALLEAYAANEARAGVTEAERVAWRQAADLVATIVRQYD